VLDTAHVGLVFTDVVRDSQCGALTCIALPLDETQRSVSIARMPGRSKRTCSRTKLFFRVSLLPTDGIRAANVGDRDFGTSPIFGQFSGKPLLASTKHLGSREAKHNGV